MEAKPVLLFVFLLSMLIFFSSIYIEDRFFATGALHISLLALALFFLYKSSFRQLLADIGVPGRLKTNILYTIGGLGAVFTLVFLMTIAFEYAQLNDQAEVQQVVKELPIPVLLLAFLLAPFSEELFFRAFLIAKAESFLSSFRIPHPGALGIILASLIFAFFHVRYDSVVEIVGAFLIGLILAIVYRRSGSIIPPILIHMIYNGVSILVMRWLT